MRPLMRNTTRLSLSSAILSIVAALIGSSCAHRPANLVDGSAKTASNYPLEWSVSEGLSNPESAYFDSASGILFVSNVAGDPGQKDGMGWISQLSPNGRVLKQKWVSGLNAPKGIRVFEGTLWVSDIDEVVSIEIATGKIASRVKVSGAKFLNDIAVGSKGEVYVSDMATSKVHVIQNGKSKIFSQGQKLESPNGLLVSGDKLYVSGWGRGLRPDFSTETPGSLFSLDLKTKQKTAISTPFGHLDGLEQLSDGSFFVSDWMAGKVFHLGADGKPQVILEGFKGAADIGLIPGQRLLVVPKMGENSVAAYRY